MRIKVIIAGFTGRMGSAALDMVKKDEELELVALLSPTAEVDELDGVPVYQQKEDLAGIDADVWVDFTIPEVAYANTRFALENGFAPVVGTTGFTESEIEELIAFSAEKAGWLDCSKLCHWCDFAHGVCSKSNAVFPRP